MPTSAVGRSSVDNFPVLALQGRSVRNQDGRGIVGSASPDHTGRAPVAVAPRPPTHIRVCRFVVRNVMSMLLTAFEVAAASADVESRTISGVALPYGVPGNPGGASGPVVFAAGSLSRSLSERANRVRLVVDHDRSRPIGRLLSFEDSVEGLSTLWKVARTPAGDDALAEAADGVRDGLSVGVEVIRSLPRDGVLEVVEARLVETSLVAFPAYESARVQRVAASESRGRDPRVLRLLLNLKEY